MTRDEIIRDAMMDYQALTACVTLNPFLRTGDAYSLGVFCGNMMARQRDAAAIKDGHLYECLDRMRHAAHDLLGFGRREV